VFIKAPGSLENITKSMSFEIFTFIEVLTKSAENINVSAVKAAGVASFKTFTLIGPISSEFALPKFNSKFSKKYEYLAIVPVPSAESSLLTNVPMLSGKCFIKELTFVSLFSIG
jgi:hypothetical protein